jgi:hypothetical protein
VPNRHSEQVPRAIKFGNAPVSTPVTIPERDIIEIESQSTLAELPSLSRALPAKQKNFAQTAETALPFC